MVTRGVRIVALAAIASTRCCSFLHGGTRLARTAASRSSALMASAPHSSRVEEVTTAQQIQAERGNADDLSMDTLLISKNPDLVLSHLRARRMGEDSMLAVQRIGGT